jgi:hypothetical protein
MKNLRREEKMNLRIRRNDSRSRQRITSLGESLKEFATLGSPVDLSVVTEETRMCKLEIQQVGGIHDSMVFQLKDGRIAYMVDLEVCNHTSKPIHIADVDLRFPWKDEDHPLQWLVARRISTKNGQDRTTAGYLEYRFPGKNGLELSSDVVINHTLVERKILPPRCPVGGYLLAIGGRMPRDLFHGGWVNASLVISTLDRAEFCESIQLWTDRPNQKQRPVRACDLHEPLPASECWREPGKLDRRNQRALRSPGSGLVSGERRLRENDLKS